MLLGDCFGGKKAGAELLKPSISPDRNHLRLGWRGSCRSSISRHSPSAQPATTSRRCRRELLEAFTPKHHQHQQNSAHALGASSEGWFGNSDPSYASPRAAAAPSAPAYGRKTTIRSPATPKLATAVAGDIPATCNHGLTLNNLFSSAKPRSSRLCIITETSPGPQSCRRPASARCSALPIKHFGEVFGSDPCPRPALLQQ